MQSLKICDGKFLTIVNLSETNFEIWSENRELDKQRVEEIKNTFIKHNYETIPGIIYIFKKNGVGQIYDGAHRYVAAKELFNQNHKDMKILITTTDGTKVEEDFFEIMPEFAKNIIIGK